MYGLVGTFPIITLFSPMLTPYFGASLWIFISFYFLVYASFYIQKYARFKRHGAEWLKQNFIFNCIEIAFVPYFIVMLAVSLMVIQPTVDVNVRLLHGVWYTAFMVGVFPYFHRVKNTLGMGFKKIEGASLSGASAFAKLAERAGLRTLWR